MGMYVCTSLFSVFFLHYTFENILYLFTPPLFLPSDFVFYLLRFRSPYSASIRGFRLFSIYLFGCARTPYIFWSPALWLLFPGSTISGIESDEVSDISVVEVSYVSLLLL